MKHGIPPTEKELDLELQIHLAEMAIIARGQRLRRGTRQIRERVGVKLGKGTIVAAAGVAAWWLGRGIARRLAPAKRPPKRSGGLLGLAAFLLPLMSGEKSGPLPGGLPALLFSVLLPWVEKLWQGERKTAPRTASPPAPGTAPPMP